MPEGIVGFNAPAAGQWGAPTLVADRYLVAWPIDGTNYTVLVHDTVTDTNTTIAVGASVLFDSAAVDVNGNVWAAATTGTNLYLLDTSSWTISTVSYGATARRWHLCEGGGDVWGLPATSTAQRLHIDVSAGTASEAALGGTSVAVRDMLLAADGNIYAVCSAAVASPSPVLKLVPSTGVVTRITPTGGTGNRYWGALTQLADGRLIAFNNGGANNAANGYVLISTAGAGSATIHSRPWGNLSFTGAAQDPSGLVYAIPQGSSTIAVVDPTGPSSSTHATAPSGTTDSMIAATTGVIYAMPRSSTDVTRIEAGVVTAITGAATVGATSKPAFLVPAALAIYAVTTTNNGVNTIIKITGVLTRRRGYRGIGLVRGSRG